MGAGEFQDFVAVRYSGLLRTAYLLTGSRPAAEDLVQTCLLRAMRRWKHIDDPLAYLRRAMVNQRTSMWRRLRPEVLTGVLPERVNPDSTNAVVVRQELFDALAELPLRMRAVLVLRYWEDLSEADTAELLDISIGTVKSQASRGLTRLRQVLPARISRRKS